MLLARIRRNEPVKKYRLLEKIDWVVAQLTNLKTGRKGQPTKRIEVSLANQSLHICFG